MIFDRYLSKPIYLVLAAWMIVFTATRLMHAADGYYGAMTTFDADLKGQQKCLTDRDQRISFKERCEELDSLTRFSPYWAALARVRDNTSMCGFTDCSVLLESVSRSVGTIGSYAVFGGALTALCGAFLYVIFSKALLLANESQSERGGKQPPLIVDTYGSIPNYAWQHFAAITGNRQHNTDNNKNKRLVWQTTPHVEEEEENH
jgi:hypothetical protein